MAMQSDWDASSSNGHPATCGRCSRSLGHFSTQAEAGAVELRHQLDKHRAALEAEAADHVQYGEKGKPVKPTRNQRRNKFPKPGKR